MKNNYIKSLIIFFIIILSTNLLFSETTAVRNDKWAKPAHCESLTNFFIINSNLYRGAQPSNKGFLELKKLGIKTIINLREEDFDSLYIKKLPFKYFHLPVDPYKPGKDIYKIFLELINDESNYPIYVHCLYGSDRTGVAIALYRIYKENWSKEDAIYEMVNGGYGFHSIFQNLIKFVKEFN